MVASGTTIGAMQAGSFVPKYTVAIEGYSHLLTDATPQQAVDAWYGDRDYASALDGLFVDLEQEQQLDPWNPFPRGGRCTLHVVGAPDNHPFRVDTHKRNAGWQTELTATADRNDTTIAVKSTSAAASSGDAWIGTECFGYTGKTATTFTGVTRGKYAPFAAAGSSTQGFAEYHRVGLNDLQARIPAYVTSLPRRWIGKWVGVWVHKLEGGALNHKSDALLVYAGRIESISVDAHTGAVVVELKHVLDCVQEGSIGSRDRWSGNIRNVIDVYPGAAFTFKDKQTAAGLDLYKNANDLIAKVGASGANEIEARFYTATELLTKINAWLRSEQQATRISGYYSFGFFEPYGDLRRIFCWWRHSASSSTAVGFEFGMPEQVRRRLGYERHGTMVASNGAGVSFTSPPGNPVGSTYHSYLAQDPYLRFAIATYGPNWTAIIDDSTGGMVDQYTYLPTAVKPATSGGNLWGVFLIDNRILVFGILIEVSGQLQMQQVRLLPEQFGLNGAQDQEWHQIRTMAGSPDSVPVSQIFVLEMPLDLAIPALLLSSGTGGYNHADDVLAYGLGLGIPAGLMSTLAASIAKLPQAASPIVLVIDKAVRLVDLMSGDLLLRRASFRWKRGSLELVAWRTPTEGDSIAILDETNKAAPVGNEDHHRATTNENGSWARPIVKILFNRNVNANGTSDDGYAGAITLVDAAAVDASGGDGATLTIKARNTFGAYQQTGAGVDALAPGYLASMPLFSNPARMATRSIDPRFFEYLGIGDVVTFTDDNAVDPETGVLGIATRYALVTGVRYRPGGLLPSTERPGDMGGEVDLFMLDVNRIAAYVPCAQVDETQTNGGYNAGTVTLTCYQHVHSASSAAADLSHFAAGDKVRIIEIDPSNPAAPLSWDRTVSGTPTAITIVLTSALTSPTWDSAKRYRIVFGDYGDVVTSQQSKVFQADDYNGQLANVRAPFEYGVGGGESEYVAWQAADAVELPPDGCYGDAVGLDTGHEMAIVRLVNNIVNYKTSHQAPLLTNAPLNTEAWSGSNSAMRLVLCYPIYLSDEVLLNDVWRRLSVAPLLWSAVEGQVATVRVTLARRPPSGTSIYNVDRGAASDRSEATFTRTSETPTVPTANDLVCNMKGIDGIAWVLVECSTLARTRGLARCVEGARLY